MQRIKSEGDYEAGKALVERYAVQVDPQLHREVRDRYYALGIEPYGGFVNPEFELVEKDGKVVDVKISYPANYVEQMLGYSKDYSFCRISIDGRSPGRESRPELFGAALFIGKFRPGCCRASAGGLPCGRGLQHRSAVGHPHVFEFGRLAFRPLVIQSRACYAIPLQQVFGTYGQVLHLFPGVSVGAVPECRGGIPPYFDAQVDRQMRPDLPGAAQ